MSDENKQPEEVASAPVGNSPKIETITGNDLEKDFQLSMPEVNEAAVAAHETREGEEKKQEEAIKAAAPGFDPAIHAVDASGNPLKNKDGTFKKRCGRKAGANSSPATAKSVFTPPKSEASPSAPAQPANAGKRDLAIITAHSLDSVLVAALSDEMKPSPEEFEMTVAAWERLYIEKGIEDLPPWAALAVIYSSRVLARADKPKVKARFSMGARILGKLTGQKKEGFWNRVADWFRGENNSDPALANSAEIKE